MKLRIPYPYSLQNLQERGKRKKKKKERKKIGVEERDEFSS